MLTRELLLFSIRKGQVRPRFVDPEDAELLTAAEDLVAIAERAPGEPKKEVDEALGALALAYRRPKLTRGLVKLLQDRMEVEEPGEAPLELRQRAFAAAMAALAATDPQDGIERYERELQARLGRPLDQVRAELHADLPDERAVASFEPIGARALLDRYNLALAQGLVMYAGRLDLQLEGVDRPEVRRLLRWMRFCRLVVQARSEGAGCRLGVEGPAALFEGSKGYGLQLASFFAAVPALPRWSLTAEIRLPRRPPARLELDEGSPLVSTFSGGAGHVPSEVAEVLARLELPGWSVDTAPAPRMIGAKGLAVPDFALIPEAGPPVVVELFHRWHRGALERRLEELAETPDPTFYVGVERALAKHPELAARVEAAPRAFLFRGFPSARTLKGIARAETEARASS